jgi:hypothetical protein
MSIVEKVTAAISGKSKTPDPADIARRIADQETVVADLQRERSQKLLEWGSRAPGSAEALDELDDRLAAAQSELGRLRDLHAAAVEANAARERQQLASLAGAQINAVTQHLAARDKAAVELTKALSLVADHYKTLVERSAKAMKARPVTMAWPAGSLCELRPIKDAIAAELYRLMGDGSTLNGAATFPGAEPSDLRLRGKPEAIEPLADVLSRASRHVLDTLKGRKPAEELPAHPPAPPPVTPAQAATVSAGAKVDPLALPPKVKLS